MAYTDDSGSVSIPQGAADIDAHRAVLEAQDMYRRVLIGWASDALTLRRQGVDEIRWPARRDDHGWSKAA